LGGTLTGIKEAGNEKEVPLIGKKSAFLSTTRIISSLGNSGDGGNVEPTLLSKVGGGEKNNWHW